MIKKRLLGVALGAIAMFIWGFVYWAGIGSSLRPFKSLPAETESAVISALQASSAETNVYAVPGPPASGASKEENDAWTEKSKQGPLASVTFIKEGKDPMAPSMMIKGLLHMLVTAFALAFCLCLASNRLPSYGKRVLFMGFVGPVNNAMFNFGYHFSGILIGGLSLRPL